MNAVNNSIYNWLNNSIPGANGSSSGVGGMDFSKLLAGLGGKNGAGDSAGAGGSGSLMDYLSRKFPAANFSEGTVGETPKDVEEYFGTEEGDNVAIAPEAAEAVAANSGLASTLESVLSELEKSAGETQPLEGARVQRNVMVTSITIRFSVSQINSRTGETMSMDELKGAFSEFSDKLQELAQKFFGSSGASGASGEEGESDIDIVAEGKEPVEGGSDGENPFSGFFAGSFSFSMFFASGQFGSQGTQGSQSSQGMSDDGNNFSVKDFMDAFRKRGNFQNALFGSFSSSMFGGMGGMNGNSMNSMMDMFGDMFGMSSQGGWQQDGGSMFKFGAMGMGMGTGGGRNLISELLNSLYNSAQTSAPAPVESEPEPAQVEAPIEETAAVA